MVSVPVQRTTTIMLSMQEALWPKLDAASSNLANSSTTGFKALLTRTSEVPTRTHGGASVSYVKLDPARRDYSQGALKQTNIPHHVAIVGDGFFKTTQERYTRDGELTVTAQGLLVNSLGDPILDDGEGEIMLPTDAQYITIGTDGTISTEGGPIARLGVYTLPNTSDLQFIGHGYYRSPQENLAEAELSRYQIMQGFVEESNVSAISETINLIEILRAYEQAQKAIDQEEKRQSQMMNLSAQRAI